jgi:hypothetical protein
LANLFVEQPILIAEGRNEAAGMAVRQVGEHLRHHFEPDEKAMQRIFIELVRAPEKVVKRSFSRSMYRASNALASSPLSLK